MNASLHRDDRRRDNLFRNFIHENGLKLANNHPDSRAVNLFPSQWEVQILN